MVILAIVTAAKRGTSFVKLLVIFNSRGWPVTVSEPGSSLYQSGLLKDWP